MAQAQTSSACALAAGQVGDSPWTRRAWLRNGASNHSHPTKKYAVMVLLSLTRTFLRIAGSLFKLFDARRVKWSILVLWTIELGMGNLGTMVEHDNIPAVKPSGAHSQSAAALVSR